MRHREVNQSIVNGIIGSYYFRRYPCKTTRLIYRLVVNIPGSDVANGETLSEYVGAGPPQGSGSL
jgi:hypothetical protein